MRAVVYYVVKCFDVLLMVGYCVEGWLLRLFCGVVFLIILLDLLCVVL